MICCIHYDHILIKYVIGLIEHKARFQFNRRTIFTMWRTVTMHTCVRVCSETKQSQLRLQNVMFTYLLFSWFIKVKVQRIQWLFEQVAVICWHRVPHGRQNYTQFNIMLIVDIFTLLLRWHTIVCTDLSCNRSRINTHFFSDTNTNTNTHNSRKNCKRKWNKCMWNKHALANSNHTYQNVWILIKCKCAYAPHLNRLCNLNGKSICIRQTFLWVCFARMWFDINCCFVCLFEHPWWFTRFHFQREFISIRLTFFLEIFLNQILKKRFCKVCVFVSHANGVMNWYRIQINNWRSYW